MRGDRTQTVSTPASFTSSSKSSSIISPAGTRTVSFFGCFTSLNTTRPRMRDSNGEVCEDSRVISIPSSAPQSSNRTITSCATSTKRRVRYPASAVLSAESVNPFRDPREDVTYSKMERPSRKFDFVGSSTIFPSGSTTSPRIAASCFTWSLLARVPPELIITFTALSSLKLFHVFSAIVFVVSIQIWKLKRRRSSCVISPWR